MEELTSENAARVETLKNILGGNKLVVLESGDVKVEIIDGSIGNDLKDNDKVGVSVHGSGITETYRVYQWGLGEVFARHEPLLTGIEGLSQGGYVGHQLAQSRGYSEWFCNKVGDLVNFVTNFMESSRVTYYQNYPRPIQGV